jgi:hypothetical protein
MSNRKAQEVIIEDVLSQQMTFLCLADNSLSSTLEERCFREGAS